MNTLHTINYSDVDSYLINADKQRESYIHQLVMNNINIQNDIKAILGFEDEIFELIHEDRYINGITADFTLLKNKNIRAIIECKAGDIGVTDFVRGIGQVLQYEYFRDKNISKGNKYDTDFNTILLIPSTVVKNNLFNLGRFKYPETTLILEINNINNVTREISKDELNKLGTALDGKLSTISQYYIRDNRLFEIFMLLKYCCLQKMKGESELNRKYEGESTLTKLLTPNNNNWRNAFISLSSLGLIDNKNLPTPSGIRMGNLEYPYFCQMMYKSYLKPYIDTLIDYFNFDTQNLNKGNIHISNDLVARNEGKDILFLTQSDGRYISSWLNILRDDFGILDFSPRSKNRKINYNISELNDQSVIENILNFTKSKQYLSNFKLII